ncbi:S8 family peptidase [Alkalimarinus alittae]|uniref:S8 family peptidase n=1 Tax=Alkalimarinus alittae TaxID=2961619 RepID=A0ABY6MZV2_9ALTE|nr:S8 family peptidase [Alkalimarinus alittae]UZE95375.1 S8 family peptidase [Alkalimarinus alittae]
MTEFKRFSSFVLTIVCTVIVGCGGGGGGDSEPLTVGTDTPTAAPTTFSVSGTIQIPAGSVADNDVMQSQLRLIPNNNAPSEAQSISNPSVTGGYVSAIPGTYTDARFTYDSDPRDIFSVKLLKDQIVTLVAFPADTSSTVDWETTLVVRAVDGSSSGDTEGPDADAKSIKVTDSKEYLIEVYANEGPVLYLLTVSQGVADAKHSLLMAYDFVPGEVLVKLKEKPSSGASASALSSFSAFQANQRAKHQLEMIEGLSHLGGSSKHGMKMKIDLSAANARASRLSTQLQDWPQDQQEKWQTLEYIEALKARDDIEWAEPNYIRKAFAVSTGDPKLDPLYPAQWHYSLIDVPAAWSKSQGTGVVVAVIDTGIASNHNDLKANILPSGYDFISQDSISGDDESGIDNNPEDEGGSFHGSHVAGTIAAVNNSVGGVGVAYEADIMPLRVLGTDGSGNDADIAQAILYAAGLDNDSNTKPAKRAGVINLSLGGPGFSNSLKSAVDAAFNQGIILVAAAGNENSSAPFYPAAFSNVVSVSAVGQTKERAPYSNFGDTITVAAPGGDMSQDANGDGNADGVLSTINASVYAWYQGTSMAAPHVSGVAALMKEVDPSLTGADFITLLASEEITDDLGASGKDNQYGYGLINASKAMEKAGATIPAFLSINPQSISFDGLNTKTSLSMKMGGSGSTIAVTLVTDIDNGNMLDAPWLTVSEQSVDGNKLGNYLVSIDRAGLAVGSTYSGTINVAYQKDGVPETPKTISVLMTVPDPNKVATVGELYVGLIERSKQEAAEDAILEGQENVLIEIFAFQTAQQNKGTYSYAFEDVPQGDYYVFASTNMDQDGLVSDVGEAQGDYPVVGAASLIEVRSADISGLDFNVGYQNVVEGVSVGGNDKNRIIRKIPDSFIVVDERNEDTKGIQRQQ